MPTILPLPVKVRVSSVTIAVGSIPIGIAVTPNGSRVYVTNEGGVIRTVAVIDTATNTLIGSPIPVLSYPVGIAITPNSARAYVANFASDVATVIDTSLNTVTGTIAVGSGPTGIDITADGTRAYVTNFNSPGTVSVIDITTNTVVGSPITVGTNPFGIAIQKPPVNKTPAQLLADLMAAVQALPPEGWNNSLISKLQQLQQVLSAPSSACSEIKAFNNEVIAQSDKKLTTTQANQFLSISGDLATALGCL